MQSNQAGSQRSVALLARPQGPPALTDAYSQAGARGSIRHAVHDRGMLYVPGLNRNLLNMRTLLLVLDRLLLHNNPGEGDIGEFVKRR